MWFVDYGKTISNLLSFNYKDTKIIIYTCHWIFMFPKHSAIKDSIPSHFSSACNPGNLPIEKDH